MNKTMRLFLNTRFFLLTITLCLSTILSAQDKVFSESFESQQNSPPKGKLLIEGQLKFGHILTINHQLTDADGMGTISYQWYINGKPIKGATRKTYKVRKADIGGSISVTLSYIDGKGTAESISSQTNQVIEGYTQYAGLLNDTGITFGDSYPTGNNKDCSGESITAQDCSSGLDAKGIGFQFVKIDNTGKPLPESAKDWQCIQDNRTGLTWEKKTANGLHGKNDTFSWYIRDGFLNGGAVGVDNANQAVCHGYQTGNDLTYCNTQAFIDRINAEKLCGHDDWRLPYREEIRNIADLSKINPSIDQDFFPNTLGKFYWTASPFASSVNYAWVYDFYDGYGNFYPRSQSYHVRLVRGNP